jgi:hypothetical protein
MENSSLDPGLRRRELLRFAAMTGAALWAQSYALAASDFWNKEKPADWTDQQKEEIRIKSPWAKKVDAGMSGGGGGGRGGGGGEGGRGGGGGEGGGGEGGGGGRGSRGGGGGNSVLPPGNVGGGQSVSLEIVWESAKPIMDAHPLALPPKLNDHYVIGVKGIPQQVLNAAMMNRGARGGSGRGGGRGSGDQAEGAAPEAAASAGAPATPPDPTAGLKRGATLLVKGKDAANADIVMAMSQGTPNMTVLFGFVRDSLRLTEENKEVDFELKLGGLSAKAKFTLKDMMYNGSLAL